MEKNFETFKQNGFNENEFENEQPMHDSLEADKVMGKITELGTIGERGANLSPDSFKIVWSGSIGINSRLEDYPDLEERVGKVLSDKEKLKSYYVKCDNNAPAQCVDGRPRKERDKNKPDRGPKVPGGTPAAALGYRIVEHPDMREDETIDNDLDEVLAIYRKHNLRFGAHIDDHTAEGFTGCGAIDKMPAILRKLSQFEANQQIHSLVKDMLGRNYEPDRFNKIVGRLIRLQGDKDSYLLRKDGGEYGYRKAVVDRIERNAEEEEETPVEKLTGPHNEVGLVINTLDGTTFDRDRFSADNNDEIQLFNYDIWRTEQLANILYPYKPMGSKEELEKQREKRQDFITFRAMYAVATMMTLTDGSVKLLVRN